MATKTYNIDINVQSKTLGQLEDQLAEVNEELKQVDRNSEAFKNLTKEAQALNKEINKTNKEIEGFTFEKRIEAADGAAKVFSGTLQGVVGTLGLLGIESEKFGEFEKRAASAIAAGLGIKDLAEGFGKLSPMLATAGSSVLKFAKTTKGALITTGVGAFVVLVGTLIANWDGVTKAVENFAKKVPIVGTVIETIKKGINGLIETFRPVLEWLGILPDEVERAQMEIAETTSAQITELEREISIAQAAGVEAQKLFELRQKLLQTELENLRAAGAEKEEIYAKETELLTLQAAERKRLHDEEIARRKEEMVTVETVSSIKAAGVAGEVEITAAGADEITNILTNKLANDKKAADSSVAISEMEAEEKRKNLMLTGIALETLSNIAGQETQAGKALASAGALINTYLAASDALKSVPFPFNFVAAAAVVANGLATVKRINETEVPGEGGGGTTAASPVSFQSPTITDASAVQSIAPQVQPAQPAIQAYVVSGDVRSSNEAEAKIQARRTFGS